MKIVTGTQMRAIDQLTIREYKIPGEQLMENAGQKVFEVLLEKIKNDMEQKIVILCGSGNNGGDGYVVARKLYEKDIAIKLYSTIDFEKLAGDAKKNYEKCLALNIEIGNIKDQEIMASFDEALKESDWIVDAILGTGLTRNVEGDLIKIIDKINESSCRVLSIDMPTGVGGDDGKIYRNAIKADLTIALQCFKIGNVLYPGKNYNGKLLIADIGIPDEAIMKQNIKINLVDSEWVKRKLPKRKQDTHKGNYGKAIVIAGSKGMAGAAVLVARSALRSGIGLIKLVVPDSINDIIQSAVIEAITVPVASGETGRIGLNDIEKLKEHIVESDVVAIGPGIGKNESMRYIIKEIVGNAEKTTIIDADGLNALVGADEILINSKNKIIITPHPGEFSRLTGLDIKEINENRIALASKFAALWGVIVVLKGTQTIIALPNQKVYINDTGNPGMATAGSGDVLAGMITALIGQKIDWELATVMAVYLHGLAGDKMRDRVGEYSLIATDLIEGIPLAIKETMEYGA